MCFIFRKGIILTKNSGQVATLIKKQLEHKKRHCCIVTTKFKIMFDVSLSAGFRIFYKLSLISVPFWCEACCKNKEHSYLKSARFSYLKLASFLFYNISRWFVFKITTVIAHFLYLKVVRSWYFKTERFFVFGSSTLVVFKKFSYLKTTYFCRRSTEAFKWALIEDLKFCHRRRR